MRSHLKIYKKHNLKVFVLCSFPTWHPTYSSNKDYDKFHCQSQGHNVVWETLELDGVLLLSHFFRMLSIYKIISLSYEVSHPPRRKMIQNCPSVQPLKDKENVKEVASRFIVTCSYRSIPTKKCLFCYIAHCVLLTSNQWLNERHMATPGAVSGLLGRLPEPLLPSSRKDDLRDLLKQEHKEST